MLFKRFTSIPRAAYLHSSGLPPSARYAPKNQLPKIAASGIPATLMDAIPPTSQAIASNTNMHISASRKAAMRIESCLDKPQLALGFLIDQLLNTNVPIDPDATHKLLKQLFKHRRTRDALTLLRTAYRFPSHTTNPLLLRNCLTKVYSLRQKRRIIIDNNVYGTIIWGLARLKFLRTATRLVYFPPEHIKINVNHFRMLIQGFFLVSDFKKANLVIQELSRKNWKLSLPDYTILFKHFVRSGQPAEALELCKIVKGDIVWYTQMLSFKLYPHPVKTVDEFIDYLSEKRIVLDVGFNETLLDHYLRDHNLPKALEVFHHLETQQLLSVRALTNIMNYYLVNNDQDEAQKYYRQFGALEIEPSKVTYSCWAQYNIRNDDLNATLFWFWAAARQKALDRAFVSAVIHACARIEPLRMKKLIHVMLAKGVAIYHDDFDFLREKYGQEFDRFRPKRL